MGSGASRMTNELTRALDASKRNMVGDFPPGKDYTFYETYIKFKEIIVWKPGFVVSIIL